MRSALLAGLSCLVSLASAAAGECDVRILTSQDPLLTWRSVSYPGGKYASFTAGIGSGAARAPSDPSDSVYVVSDRGPNFPCNDAEDIIGPESEEICPPKNAPEYKTTRIYPTPDYSPSIYRLELDRKQRTFAVKDVISLKTASGKSVSGLLNPQKVAETDKAIDLKGDCRPQDINAVDAEAIVRLSDGTFWIADEMAPSLLQVRADGRIVKRLVPANARDDYAGADTEIVASLPEILSQRARNRGIEGLAVSPQERFLYFMLQSPLANPDEDAYKKSKNVRLFKLDLETGKLVGEYVYRLDDPKLNEDQNELRVSELTSLGNDRFLVLERTEKRTALYEIVLDEQPTNILDTKWDDVDARPTLEGLDLDDLKSAGIQPVIKTAEPDLNLENCAAAPNKIEGMTLLGDGSLFLINDNDFGIRGDATKAMIVKDKIKPAGTGETP